MIEATEVGERRLPIEALVCAALALSMAAVPISATAKSICLGISLLLIFFSPLYRADLQAQLKTGWCKAALLFFSIVVIATLWSPAFLSEKLLVLEKYSKILYLPILAVGFRDARTRKIALQAFLWAMLVTCLLSILKDFGLIKYHGMDPGRVFRNHIMTGYMIAFAAYISAVLCYHRKSWDRGFYAFLLVLFSYQIFFVNTGRTGYMIYLLLMALFFIQIFSWRQALLAILLTLSSAGILYMQNANVHARVHLLVENWHAFKKNDKDTSIGYRLQFHQYAEKLFKEHPFFGLGTAGFTHSFAQDKPVPTWDRTLLEPHSQYWLVASEFGLLGIAALLLFFLALCMESFKLRLMRPIAFAVLLPFLVGNLTDSLLFYSGTGYLFILFMALCFGEALTPSTEKLS